MMACPGSVMSSNVSGAYFETKRNKDRRTNSLRKGFVVYEKLCHEENQEINSLF